MKMEIFYLTKRTSSARSTTLSRTAKVPRKPGGRNNMLLKDANVTDGLMLTNQCTSHHPLPLHIRTTADVTITIKNRETGIEDRIQIGIQSGIQGILQQVQANSTVIQDHHHSIPTTSHITNHRLRLLRIRFEGAERVAGDKGPVSCVGRSTEHPKLPVPASEMVH
jgi:hypothetical protein